MTEVTIKLDDATAADTCFSVVGFLKFENNDAIPAGSGTLVRLGHIGGILTAGHVIKNLPEPRTNKVIGLVRFSGPSSQSQQYKLSMFYTDSVTLWDGVDGSAPDLAFLLIPEAEVRTLEAAGAVFYNLEKERDFSPRDNDHRMATSHVVVGSVAEWAEVEVDPKQKTRKRIVGGLLGAAKIEREYVENQTALVDVEVDYSGMVRVPESYEGVSGGPLWQLHTELKGDKPVGTRKKLHGVAFRQQHANGRHLIGCNGWAAVTSLIAKMRAKWPPRA